MEEKTFTVWADIEVSWAYEVQAESAEEALKMFNSGNHSFHVVEERIGSMKAVQITDEDDNLTFV